jgi:hypothetical protein
MLIIPQLLSARVQGTFGGRNLGGNPDLGPVSAPVFDSLTDFGFVAVNLGTVEMCVAGLQSNPHCIAHFAFL